MKKYKNPNYEKEYNNHYYITVTKPRRQKAIEERIANGGAGYHCRKNKMSEEEKKVRIKIQAKKYYLKNKDKIYKYISNYQKKRNFLLQLCNEYLKKNNIEVYNKLKEIINNKFKEQK